MDTRSLRTSRALRAAVLTLAEHGPIAQVTASAVCAEADVTRDTFYRHATDPVSLLATALGEELAAALDDIPRDEPLGFAERVLLRHIDQRADIYRGAMDPLLASPVRRILDESIRTGLHSWLEIHPHVLPAPLAQDELGTRVAIAYAAAGTVGAIEEWLRSGESETDRAVEMILAASPQWWLSSATAKEGEAP